jgi:antitoxin component YwqK of YwqJK toxin-antitoxin module
MKKTLLTLTTLSLITSQLQAEYVETFFDRGQIKAKTNYVDGTRSEKREGIKHGYEKVYYQSGQLAYGVMYVKDKRDGKLEWLDREGKLLSICHYKLGKMHGIEKTFFTNAKLKKEVNYVNDLKEGMQKEYFDNGQLALEVNYVHNKKEGIQKEYTPEGKIYSKVNFVHNYREGKQEWFDEKGKVSKTTVFKMDRPIKLMKEVQKVKPNKVLEELKALNFSPNRKQD